jgi:hypothetical protein
MLRHDKKIPPPQKKAGMCRKSLGKQFIFCNVSEYLLGSFGMCLPFFHDLVNITFFNFNAVLLLLKI